MRASEKRILYVRDTGSRWFEEAYFVLRRGASEADGSASDMAREAQRLVADGLNGYPHAKRRAQRRARLLCFLCGAAAAASAALLGRALGLL